jgi:hypothetical protein
MMMMIWCKFISSQIHVYYTYMMHILQQCMKLPVKNLYFFIYEGGILKVIPVWRCHCNDICMFIAECIYPDVSVTSVGDISVDVICISPNDYKTITM